MRPSQQGTLPWWQCCGAVVIAETQPCASPFKPQYSRPLRSPVPSNTAAWRDGANIGSNQTTSARSSPTSTGCQHSY